MDYDVIIVGSGFGGSVCALRLTEKGYRVAVLEQGRRFQDADLHHPAIGGKLPQHVIIQVPGRITKRTGTGMGGDHRAFRNPEDIIER